MSSRTFGSPRFTATCETEARSSKSHPTAKRQPVTQRAILQPGVQPGVPEEDKEGIAGDYSKNIKVKASADG